MRGCVCFSCLMLVNNLLQYGVKIIVITSFKHTCYIEILPNVQRSKRGTLSRSYCFNCKCWLHLERSPGVNFYYCILYWLYCIVLRVIYNANYNFDFWDIFFTAHFVFCHALSVSNIFGFLQFVYINLLIVCYVMKIYEPGRDGSNNYNYALCIILRRENHILFDCFVPASFCILFFFLLSYALSTSQRNEVLPSLVLGL